MSALRWSLIVVLFAYFSTCCGLDFPLDDHSSDYILLSKSYAKAWLDGLVPTAVANVSEECRNDSILYRDSLRAMESWALKMFDATGKLPDGILNGNWHALGDYEECLRIKLENITFRGKYCQVFLWPVYKSERPVEKMFPLWLFRLLGSGEAIEPAPQAVLSVQQPSIGLCVPSSCSASDVSTAVTAMTTQNGTILDSGVGFYGSTSEGFCSVDTDEAVELDVGSIAIITVLTVLGFFLLVGTLLDIASQLKIVKKGSGVSFKVLNSFSILSNGSKLLSTKASDGDLSCIHGLRFLSFSWVLVGHTYSVTSFPTANYGLLVNHVKNSVAFQAVTNAYLSVDSFFFMSGLLLSYLYLKAMQKTGRQSGITCQVNPPMLILHRYLRLTPAYALILGFFATIWPKLNDGPAWDLIEFYSNSCRETWWAHLLYINNLLTEPSSCLPVTWYLAVEFQIFLVATLFVWLMHRFELIGVLATAAATLIGCIVGAVFMIEWDMPPTDLLFANSQFTGVSKYASEYYRKPWFRFPSFFVGLLVGWLLYKVKQPSYVKPRWLKAGAIRILVLIGWCCTIASAAAVLYGMFEYMDGDPELPQEVQAVYGGFHRTIWAICLGWLVFACSMGYGGPINAFLSFAPFVFLGRLTFCAYLIHLDWIEFYLAYARSPLYYTSMTMSYSIIGHLTVTLILSTVATLAFESPFLNLEKLIFMPKTTAIPRKDNKESRSPEDSSVFENRDEEAGSNPTLRIPRLLLDDEETERHNEGYKSEKGE